MRPFPLSRESSELSRGKAPLSREAQRNFHATDFTAFLRSAFPLHAILTFVLLLLYFAYVRAVDSLRWDVAFLWDGGGVPLCYCFAGALYCDGVEKRDSAVEEAAGTGSDGGMGSTTGFSGVHEEVE